LDYLNERSSGHSNLDGFENLSLIATKSSCDA
jgi:hypothetical protein